MFVHNVCSGKFTCLVVSLTWLLCSVVVQNFVTDLATMGLRVNEVNSEVDKIMRLGHAQSQMIRNRQQQLNEKLGYNNDFVC